MSKPARMLVTADGVAWVSVTSTYLMLISMAESMERASDDRAKQLGAWTRSFAADFLARSNKTADELRDS